MAERIVFGMQYLDITQLGTNYTGEAEYSHNNWEIDIAGGTTGIEPWINYQQTVYFKVLAKVYATDNTVIFGTCNAQGQELAVQCADGTVSSVSLGMTHANSFNYEVGHIFSPSQVMYYEGTAGQATGNHIHLDVAKGWQYTYHRVNNAYVITGEVDARNVLWIYTPKTTVIDTLGAVFKATDDLNSPYVPTEETKKKKSFPWWLLWYANS